MVRGVVRFHTTHKLIVNHLKTFKNMTNFIERFVGYKFSELSEDAKNKAAQQYLEYERQTEFFSDDLVYELNEKYGLSDFKPYYSISYSQGDGLCMEGEITHSELFDNEKFDLVFDGISPEQKTKLSELFCGTAVVFEKRNHHYDYAKTVEIIERTEELETEEEEALVQTLISNIQVWYLDFCEQWYRQGYKFFYDYTEAEINEFCECNDYMFKQDGTMFWTEGYELADNR